MSTDKKYLLAAFVSGAIFAYGLLLSEMANPAKVLGFLDITGLWDPSLLLVMMGAIPTAALGFRWMAMRSKPLFAAHHAVPATAKIDAPLIIGAVLFGIGWGIAGICPGPAVLLAVIQPTSGVLFLSAMALGIALHALISPRA